MGPPGRSLPPRLRRARRHGLRARGRRTGALKVGQLSLNKARLDWYFTRLRAMSASEVGWRVEDHVKKWAWVPYQVAPDLADRSSPRRWLTHRRFVLAVPDDKPRFAATLDATALAEVPTDVRADLIAGADEILAGRWTLLGVRRQDMEGPGLVLRPADRSDGSEHALLLRHRPSFRRGHREHQADLGTVTDAARDRPGRRFCPLRR